MNTLELYRLLPRTNCGRCRPGACMAFAVCLSQGKCDPAGCPDLEEETREKLAGKIIRPGDWRDDLIESLWRELAATDLAAAATSLGVEPAGKGGFAIRYNGKSVTWGRKGFDVALAPWDRILILRYLLSKGAPSPGENWTAFRDLKGGIVKATAFRAEVEGPFAKLHDEQPEGVTNMLLQMDADRRQDLPSDLALLVRPLPKIPWLFQVWKGEEGMPSDCTILMDRTATAFLDVESLIFLGEQLIERFTQKLSEG